MDYQEVMEYIKEAGKFGSKLDLVRMESLAKRLGNPQNELQFIHVAGTNGKGSTAAYLSTVLREAGYRAGLYTSPFIYEFNERIQVDGLPVGDEELAEVMTQVREAARGMVAEGQEHPTEFELITAAAFLYFKVRGCDIVVLEVGMGGRFDATNLIEKPLVSVITAIGMDHMEYLGDTLEKIAFEKCGIIKPRGVTVSYAMQPEQAREVIRRMASERENRLVECSLDGLELHSCGLDGNEFSYGGFDRLRVRLCGEYQVYNAVTALNVLRVLRERGLEISEEAVRSGLYKTKWPGRFEQIGDSPLFIVDGSHNLDGMRAFVRTTKKCLDGKPAVCIFGMLKDKEYQKCLQELSALSKQLVITRVDSPRTAEPEKLAEAAAGLFEEIHCLADNGEAVRKAVKLAGKDGVVLAVGSLYMIDGIRKNARNLS